MKPTQQDLIRLARLAGFHVGDQFVAGASEDDLERFATLLLERFGAGGGEPFGYFCDWGDHDGLQRIAMYYGEPGSATFDDWNEYPKVHKNLPLYTHPSPTDLRAEYLRGLEEGFKEGWIECSKWAQRDDLIADIGSPSYEACVSAVKALKGKQ